MSGRRRVPNAETAQVVAGAGDTDGDGLDDLLIGGPGDDDGGEGAGAAWLVLGESMVSD